MDEARAAASTVPLEILRNQLEQYRFRDRSLRRLGRCQEFLESPFLSQQISSVHEFARLERGLEISIGSVERAFNCSPAAMEQSLRNGLEPPKPRGRPTALAGDAEAEILAWIQHPAEKSQPSTRMDIVHSSVSKFGKSITRGCPHSFVIRHKGEVTETGATCKKTHVSKWLESSSPQRFAAWKKCDRVLFGTCSSS
jgi:hypothetical protein